LAEKADFCMGSQFFGCFQIDFGEENTTLKTDYSTLFSIKTICNAYYE
jgi:hypothetical protein